MKIIVRVHAKSQHAMTEPHGIGRAIHGSDMKRLPDNTRSFVAGDFEPVAGALSAEELSFWQGLATSVRYVPIWASPGRPTRGVFTARWARGIVRWLGVDGAFEYDEAVLEDVLHVVP